jgi:biopolymer transport protein ExbD
MAAAVHIPRSATFRHRRISTPQGMDIMAGVVLLLVMFYMLTTRQKHEENGPYLNLPTSFHYPGRLPDSHFLIISLDVQNRAYVATSDEATQTAMVMRIAKRHHVRFTATQVHELRQLKFLSQNVFQLPTWLSASTTERQQMATGISAELGTTELMEYVLAGQDANRAVFGKPAYIVLRIDKDASTKNVKQLIRLLQRQGINRYNLLADLVELPRNK